MSVTKLHRLLRSATGAGALALCALAAQSMTPASAATRTVGNCNDAGPGSLRNAVAVAASGDTIDLTALSCSRIALDSGRIDVPQDDLTLIGPGAPALVIDGNRQDRVFAHSGTGTLRLRRLSVARGHVASPQAWGGCIYSAGDVELTRTHVHRCVADARGPAGEEALGAGVFARGTVTLSHSRAFYNKSDTIGGAIMADEVVLDHSTLYENQALRGGGFYALNATIDHSVVRNNHAAGFGGGVLMNCLSPGSRCRLAISNSTLSANRAGREAAFSAQSTHRIVIRNSTITGNVANQTSVARLPTGSNRYWGWVRIYNSTIASNHEQPQDGQACAGAIGMFGGLELLLESTIVSGNTCSLGDDKDIYGGGAVLTGGHNVIGRSEIPVPDDTILATDPRLAPLANNGGPTPTRRPLADSPALDRGSNALDCPYDQRGPGFPRVQGAFAEIGAIER